MTIEINKENGRNTKSLSFTIHGVQAMTAGSKRQMHHYLTNKIITLDACKGSAAWKTRVASEASVAMIQQNWQITDAPLVLSVTFMIARPKSHYRVSKKLGIAAIRDTAPIAHTQKPDALKFMRAVEDAMTGMAYFDDAQIVVSISRKMWGSQHETFITLRSATEEDIS